MGMRHQAFLIARVRPRHGDPAYRCIAAFHHQWCYGTLPLLAMHRFLRLLTQPENAAIVRAELRSMDGKYDRGRKDESPMPAVPCPYSLSLLGIAWTASLDAQLWPPSYDGVTLRQGVLNANMGCWDGHNDEGISVIDVTSPLHPKYCFMKYPCPLSPYEYLNTQYALNLSTKAENISRFVAAIIYISGIPLLKPDPLEEAWPGVFFYPRPEQDHVVISQDYAHSLYDPDYAFRAWDTAVQRLLTDPDDDEPREWYAVFGPAGLPNSDAAYLKLNTYLLRHPRVFDFQFVLKPAPRDNPEPGLLKLFLKLAARDASDEELAELLSGPMNSEHIRTTLRQLSPFPDDHLDSLVKLMTFGGDHFADLSGYDLSAAQVARFISRCPDIDSLDISENSHIVLSDIPTIVTAAPHLLRLNVCGCIGIDGQALLDLLRTQPSLFRTVEAIIHPALLTINKPPNFPIAFTFMLTCKEFDIHGVSLPLFTPTQVMQALRQLLPLAWRSGMIRNGHHVRVDANLRSNTQRQWMFPVRTWYNEPGTLHTASPILTYAAFSGGSQRRGVSWSDRAVVGVPLHPYPSVSHRPEGSWAFYLDVNLRRSMEAEDATWAFIHYAPDPEETVTEEELAGWTIDNGFDGSGGVPSQYKRKGKVHDLRGFLRGMAEEGRPLPPEELVAEIEALLYTRHEFDGQLVCPLLSDDDAPMALTFIPSTDVRSSNGTPLAMIDAHIRSVYARESEVYPHVYLPIY